MSDIYLQITETPTVVTLSAPVISGAFTSTVTVANTVTVALDANSLSALENVTVTVGAAITGTVTVSNFPASQAVTFSAVSISNFPASQAVTFSGISVSNFPASQAVTFSDASLTNTQLRASAVTVGGTITVGNFPASQAVTFGQAIVSASNITGLNNSVGTDGNTPTSTNFIKIGGHQDGSNQVEHIVHVSAGGSMKVDASDSTVTFGTIRGTVTIGNSITIGSLPAISGTVTAIAGTGFAFAVQNGISDFISDASFFPISGTVTIGSALPAGTNRIGVVTIGNIQRAGDSVQSSLLTEAGSGYLLNRSYLGAGLEQIGSVTASISGTVPISISSVTVGSVPPIQWSNASGGNAPTTVNQNAPLPVQLYTGAVPSSVTIGAIIANSVTIGSLPAISGTVTANTFALQGTAVTTSNFTSTTASTVLANFNATREVLTIFNEGAGNLHICAGATCTTIAYQVRLSAGDYYEVPNHQTTITHSAVFATAGTARVTEVS
jgi:hypothetical protein